MFSRLLVICIENISFIAVSPKILISSISISIPFSNYHHSIYSFSVHDINEYMRFSALYKGIFDDVKSVVYCTNYSAFNVYFITVYL